MDFDRVSQMGGRTFERPGSDIRITGYLKKMKTMKKKFFILRSTSSSGPARLEYYDSEKKFNTGHLPKRSIHLHTCFNINRKSDGRHKYAIALYTNEECFSVVCDNEKEMDQWLMNMLEYQNEYVRDDERCREHYEHVWQVTVQPKGLGQTKNLRGQYRLCMTRSSICLVKLNSDKPQYVFQLETVRSLAHSENLFRLEVGKIAPTGEGELWMQADDAVTAQNLHETILNYMKNMHSSGNTFRTRTSSESQGSSRVRLKPDRPVSVYTPTSSSHLHSAISPGTSPHTGFGDPGFRSRTDSNASRSSHSSIPATSIMPDDPMFHDHPLPFPSDITPLEEESDFVIDQRSLPSSPGSHLAGEPDEPDSHAYVPMGSATPPSSNNSGYMTMAPGSKPDSLHPSVETSSSYMPMHPGRSSASAPIPIHTSLDSGPGYMDMASHILPPVQEGGSNEGYVPMSPTCSASPSGSSSSHLRPDPVVCPLHDDVTDQPPLRTYSLGSRPLPKTGTAKYPHYMDMSGRKGVSDKDRSCSAPHLIAHHARPTGHNTSVDSPTPSASPLSMSLRSDDSDSFMEFDFFHRPRTASDSYSYRPRASSFGMQQKNAAQGHRPRSSSHGQGTRPVHRHKLIGLDAGRLSQDMLYRTSLNSSHGSWDSLRVSSSESLRKLSLEVRAKTSQLNNAGYMDMSFDKRQTPSPQAPTNKAGYMDMTLGNRKTSSPGHTRTSSRASSKTNSTERLPDTDYTNMTLGDTHHDSANRDSVYMNVDGHDTTPGHRKHESPSRASPADNGDSYIPYEPAANSGGGGSGKAESVSPDPRARSSSGGKEHKKWGLFSLRHGHSDTSSSKSSKRGEAQQQQQQVRSASMGGVGDRVVSLGHDIRRKSKDINKGGRQKSASFSRLLESRQGGSSGGGGMVKSGKPSRKVPTPPQASGEVMDEYIEFAPVSIKSDSDSSHSSGSTRTSRRKEEVVSAKAEPEYVGFEPGNIVSAKSGGNSQSSGYVPMGSAFKPVAKSDSRRSRGRKEAAPTSVPSPAIPRETTFQPVQSYASQKASTNLPGGLSESSTAQSLSTPSLPATVSSKVSPTPNTIDTRSKSATPPFSAPSPGSSLSTIPTPSSSESSVVSVTLKSSTQKASESGYMDFDPGKPLPATSTESSSDSISAALTRSVSKSKEKQATKEKQALVPGPMLPPGGPLPVVMEVMHSSGEVLSSPGPGLDADCLTDRQQPVGEAVNTKTSPTTVEGRNVANTSATKTVGDTSPAALGSAVDKPQETRMRKVSGSKMVVKLPSVGSSGDQTVRESPSAGSDTVFFKSGEAKSRTGSTNDNGEGGKTKETKPASPRGVQRPGVSTGGMPNLTRPESTPCMQSLATTKPGTGRGRHSSAGSKPAGNGSNGDGKQGMLKINTGTESRHSIPDLSGYEHMAFPTDALSRQQPLHTQNRQNHTQPGSAGSATVLNYATLDLGSADSMGESSDMNRSPRNKSRHPSSADERGEPPVAYATIDFEKSENLWNTDSKDVKFTL